MSITAIARKIFLHRQKKIDTYSTCAEELQVNVLRRLLHYTKNTEYGKKYSFEQVKGYEDFVRNVPTSTYEDLKVDIDRMRRGEKNVLWPGKTIWFAKSSGTTNDRSKYIPITQEGIKDLHYRGGLDVIALYLKNNPYSKILDGKGLILGGSHETDDNTRKNLVGDLSAILIERMNPIMEMFRAPCKSTALLKDFEIKRDMIARQTANVNISNLSGVPSWMLSVLRRMLEITNKTYIDEIWPNLEVFFHGGVSFDPYRKQYNTIIRSSDMRYMETYNASEGFFGIQSDLNDKNLLLMLDYGVFYEFVPMSNINDNNPPIVPIWGVETGKNYAMIISTTCGLWRYALGDTVCFTKKRPYKFYITGRTKSYINAFGEELMVDNAEKALTLTCNETQSVVRDYTAAPIFMNERAKCRHQWLIDFIKKPQDIEQFALILDNHLREINSDYDAKRKMDITLQRLEVIQARANLFEDWLQSKGKLGGQHKVPRLNNDRKVIEELLKYNRNAN